MDLILIAVLIQTTLMVGGGILIYIVARRFKKRFTEFITPPAEGQPSPLAAITAAVTDNAAQSIVNHAKSTFMGIQSGAKRAAVAIEGDIAEGIASSNPLLGGILSSFPALKKTLRRNPELTMLAANKLQSMLTPSGPAGPGGNGNNSTPKFKL